ncbi:hypothetical protein [Paraburkholderia sp. BCC1884]|uniref:DoxX family protein n=1 Tax=Paraburkholderia sp. BCC1884 TaxID=2562668 RepID=UPI001182BAE6|nr:hypothetical protein [Paraburkholderia sp. BCC1884]
MKSPYSLPRPTPARRLALGFVFLWFSIGGVCHFVYTASFVGIVPPSIPQALAAVYISGFFELLGALGLIPRHTRRYAGWGLAALTVAVTPANVFMWQHPERFPSIPLWLLFVRLPFQAVLILCILWSTHGRGRSMRS